MCKHSHTHTHTHTYIYIYIYVNYDSDISNFSTSTFIFKMKEKNQKPMFYIYIYIFKQVLLKTMEHCLIFLILFFQDSLLFFKCRDMAKESSHIFNPRAFNHTFGRHQGYPDTRKITRSFEKMKLKMINEQCSIVFNKTCLNNNLLSKCKHFKKRIYVCVCVCARARVRARTHLRRMKTIHMQKYFKF